MANHGVATTIPNYESKDIEQTNGTLQSHDTTLSDVIIDDDGNNATRPNEEEKYTLRKVAGRIPTVAYWLCAVEFAERASYYGVQPLFGNFVKNKLPNPGNGAGSPPRDDPDGQAGALHLGSSKSNAITQSFSMFVYMFPIFWGWLSDQKTGRWTIICWGVAVCGIAHIIMVGSAAPALLQAGKAVAPFIISVYILGIGAAMFKPCISPTLLDQMPLTEPVTKTLETGEKVIVDPDATTERIMLWFYLLINCGGFINSGTSYAARDYGYWLAFLIPLILYFPLPLLLWYLKKRLILLPPAGSDLGWALRIIGVSFRRGGLFQMFKRNGDFFGLAKPSHLSEYGSSITVPWTDEFVEDVRRAFQACAIFMFFPIQNINDNGLGQAANIQSNMLKASGVPNDLLSNFNSLVIIIVSPILNYMLYPWLRNRKVPYGPIARITTGMFISTIGGLAYTIINYYGYKTSPCGNFATADCKDADGHSAVSTISLWWQVVPYGLGGLSELFVNVPAYGLAYSRSPKNMRGLVSSINLFSAGLAYAFGLACSKVITDPYLTWVFAGPTIIGAVATPLFWFIYRDIDKEEYRMAHDPDFQKEFKQVHHIEKAKPA